MTRIPDDVTASGSPISPLWSLARPEWAPAHLHSAKRARVLVDNDFAGDPDDLFQIVHQLLSPSVEIRGIICSHELIEDDENVTSADDALLVVRDLFRRMGITDTHLLRSGANRPLGGDRVLQPSDATALIVNEALREDPRPLFYAAGGSLTELAIAFLREPRIADRLTLVWIGGPQHDSIVGASGRFPSEYNRDADPDAARIVFDAGFDIWQVPRDVYRACLMSESEMRTRVAQDGGPLGEYLYGEVAAVLDDLAPRIGRAEMYPMGDQPLVLLTALQGDTVTDDFTSNQYVEIPTPAVANDGSYVPRAGGRSMRVYTHLDVRLMFEDMFAKLREFAAWRVAAAVNSG